MNSALEIVALRAETGHGGSRPVRSMARVALGTFCRGQRTLPGGFLTGVVCIFPKSISRLAFLQASRGRIQGPSRHSSLPGLCWALRVLREGEQALLMFPPARRLLLQTAIMASLYTAVQSKASAPLPRGFPTICSQMLPVCQLACKTEVCMPTDLISHWGVLKFQDLFVISIFK